MTDQERPDETVEELETAEEVDTKLEEAEEVDTESATDEESVEEVEAELVTDEESAEEQEQSGVSQEAQELAEHEDEQVLQFLKEYGMPVLVGIAAALIIYFGFVVYQSYQTNLADRAAQGLLTAQSADQLEDIVTRYPATPSAPVALLTLCSTYLHAGKYDLAREAYTRFQSDYPEHEMHATAEIGLGYCAEAEGNLESALELFTAFVAAYPDHYLTPQAMFSRARCLEQSGRYGEAKAVYEEFIAGHPDSRWVPQAETALLYVDKSLRLAEAQ